MTRIFCDCCGKEQTGTRLYKFSHLCHLSEDRRGKLDGHIDTKTMQPISGRDDTKEMCITCYNTTVVEAVKKFEELRGSHV
jgi:hypothetical protein